MSKLLEVRSLSKQFGGVRAVIDVSFVIDSGEFVGLIGPNGAGKTTLFDLLTGLQRPNSGEIVVDGMLASGRTPQQVSRMGVARTFQLVNLFDSMTVAENVAVALMARGQEPSSARQNALPYLRAVGLEREAGATPSELPFSARRKAELARAMAQEPRVLLVDEAMAGLTTDEIKGLVEVLQDIARSGVAVVAIEHNLDFVMNHCSRVIVLDQGRLIADAAPDLILDDPAVVQAYVGDWTAP